MAQSETINRWRDTPPPVSFLTKEVLNKTKNPNYRLSLILYLGSSKGKVLISEKDKPEVAEMYFALLKDTQEKPELRAESMVNLTVLQPDKNTYYRLVDMLNAKEDILKGYTAQIQCRR